LLFIYYKKLPTTIDAESICVIAVIKHAPPVLHMKEMDVGLTRCCRYIHLFYFTIWVVTQEKK